MCLITLYNMRFTRVDPAETNINIDLQAQCGLYLKSSVLNHAAYVGPHNNKNQWLIIKKKLFKFTYI